MRYHNIANMLLNTPVAIEKRKLQTITSYFLDRNGFDTDLADVWDNGDLFLAEYSEVDKKDKKMFNQIGDTAIIHILGTLTHRAGAMDAISGLTSYQKLRKVLKKAVEDSTVSKIVLDIDSGGGSVAGLFDLVDDIKKVSTVKPVFAFSNENCFSAAYAIASAATKIFVSRTSGVGSIGVIAQHTDISKMNEMDGIKITPVFAGEQKIDLNPNFPLSDDAQARLQNEVDNLHDIFVATVASNRNLTENAVRDTEAGLFFGPDAVQIGLADEVSSFDDFIDEVVTLNLNDGSLFSMSNQSQEKKQMGILDKVMSKDDSEAQLDQQVEDKLEDEQLSDDVDSSSEEEVSHDVSEDDLSEKEEVLEDSKEEAEKEAEELEGDEEANHHDDEVAEDQDNEEMLDPADIAAQAVAAGQPQLVEALIRQGVTQAQLDDRLDATAEIKRLCEMAGVKSKADGFIDQGLSVSDVKDQLWDAMAARSEASDVSTMQDPEALNESVEEVNVIMADVNRRIEEAGKTKR